MPVKAVSCRVKHFYRFLLDILSYAVAFITNNTKWYITICILRENLKTHRIKITEKAMQESLRCV